MCKAISYKSLYMKEQLSFLLNMLNMNYTTYRVTPKYLEHTLVGTSIAKKYPFFWFLKRRSIERIVPKKGVY